MQRFGFLSLVLVTVALVSASAGCGGDGDSADSPTESSPPASSSAVPFDRSFIDSMVPHHRSAIEMAQEAKRAGLAQPELIAVADDIVASQQQEIDQLLDWREEWFGSRTVDPDGSSTLGMSESEMGMGMEHGADAIAEADDVDSAFAEAMIPHHEGAIAMAKLAQEKAQHDEINELAGSIIDAQDREIGILRKHTGGGGHGG